MYLQKQFYVFLFGVLPYNANVSIVLKILLNFEDWSQ